MPTILRDIVIPTLTLATFAACVYFTYLLVRLGSVGGAISAGLLAVGFGLFVWHDARRLLAKYA